MSDGCPSLSPDTKVRCVLPDNAGAHEAGHGAMSDPSVAEAFTVWDTTPTEVARWAQDETDDPTTPLPGEQPWTWHPDGPEAAGPET